MRIAVITNTLDQTGGAGRIAATYNELLQAHGHEVRVWSARAEFAKLGTMNPLARLFFHLRDLSADRKIVAEINAWKPDALLTHNLTGCGFGTPKSIGVRWVHVLHDVQLFEPSGQIVFGESFSFLRLIWRWKWGMLRRLSFGRPDVVVSPTKWLLDEHGRRGFFKNVKTEIIPNPIKQLYEVGAEGVDRRGVLYVGRLDRDKGVDLLIGAWMKLKSTHTKLVLIGDGSMRREIELLNDPTIEVHGPQPSEEVLKAMRESAIVVVPSRVIENQPTVILEALASGCRVVATNVGGIPETLGDAGWIVKAGSVEALVVGINDALRSAPKQTNQILAQHEPERCVNALVHLLKSNL